MRKRAAMLGGRLTAQARPVGGSATGDARTAHVNGQIPAALANVSADLLASDPDIRPIDVVAVK